MGLCPSLPHCLSASLPSSTPSYRRGRSGFTFTEIMFAVVILGIGFIMVAGMLPVAIRLSQQSADETIAASTAQRVFQAVQNYANATTFPPTAATYSVTASPGTAVLGYNAPYFALGEVNPASAPSVPFQRASAALQFNAFRAELVSSLDRTYGVALAYSRQGTITYSPSGVQTAAGDLIRVVAVVARVRDRSTFNDEDAGGNYFRLGKDVKIPDTAPADPSKPGDFGNQYVDRNGTAQQSIPATLQFKRFTAQFSLSSNGAPDTVTFVGSPANPNTGDLSCVGPGAFVIVANVDPTTNNPCFGSPTLVNGGSSAANGKVFRLGDAVDKTNTPPLTYQLVTGYDLSGLPANQRPPYLNGAAVEVLVLGKSLQDPSTTFNASTNPYTGQPMDVAVYTTTIGLRQQQ